MKSVFNGENIPLIDGEKNESPEVIAFYTKVNVFGQYGNAGRWYWFYRESIKKPFPWFGWLFPLFHYKEHFVSIQGSGDRRALYILSNAEFQRMKPLLRSFDGVFIHPSNR